MVYWIKSTSALLCEQEGIIFATNYIAQNEWSSKWWVRSVLKICLFQSRCEHTSTVSCRWATECWDLLIGTCLAGPRPHIYTLTLQDEAQRQPFLWRTFWVENEKLMFMDWLCWIIKPNKKEITCYRQALCRRQGCCRRGIQTSHTSFVNKCQASTCWL